MCRGVWVGEGVLVFKIRDVTMIENQFPLLCIFIIPFKFQSARILYRWIYESEVFLRRNSRKWLLKGNVAKAMLDHTAIQITLDLILLLSDFSITAFLFSNVS